MPMKKIALTAIVLIIAINLDKAQAIKAPGIFL